jgi:hypothetical protein
MSIESSIEQRIREAMARGEFDDLKGKGKPLDLNAYFATPEELRMAYSILKSNDFVPEEVEMLREIADLKEALKAATDPDEQTRLTRKLNERNLAYTIAIEKYRRKR